MFLLTFYEKNRHLWTVTVAISASRVSSGYSMWILKPKLLPKLDVIPH